MTAKEKTRLVSPNEIFEAAKAELGWEPKTDFDWQVIVNFWAFNIDGGVEVEGCQLLAAIFSCPLSDETIKEIAAFQIQSKETLKCQRLGKPIKASGHSPIEKRR